MALKNAESEDMVEVQQIELLKEDDEKQLTNSSLSNTKIEILSEEQQIKLFEKGNEGQRVELASYPYLSEAVQYKLAKTDNSREVKCQLARNPSLSIAVQAILSVDENSDVKQALASNPSLPEPFLARLMDDKNSYVQIGLAGNPSLPESFLARLMDNNNYDVQVGLAGNPSLKVSQQEELIKQREKQGFRSSQGNSILGVAIDGVCLNLLENPSLDEALRTRVIADLFRSIRRF